MPEVKKEGSRPGRLCRSWRFWLCLSLAVLLLAALAAYPAVFLPGRVDGAAPFFADADGHINVNTAPAEELSLLPGIGPGLAEKIINYREAHGPFTCPEDLLAVPGLGPVTLEKIRDLICF